ncbi:trypsin-like serine protease [Roseospira marina]|uniref:Trypsin-like serine protease n=1 Tax=Roseospira marina TaxID=140057 RepID=A0A5M6I7B2_9PROT|nr:trypsin-like peptidase domain-containing protein [Roseospira marina]KAA5604150.1 trypsin-like serine protease [Roseospira marina]MBB4315753.1 V8-like Glu-specific endopeptidase [Roseospira marina]MBB5088920.1 V8-like Glu-specific endopeptidase [Roseospira marina]
MTTYVEGANDTYPYSGVCYVIADFGGSNVFAATGFMVGPNDVLTASHVIYDAAWGVANSVTVIPGYDAGVALYGEYTASTIDYLPIDTDGDGLIFASESAGDIAVLGLNSRVGDTTGLFGLDGGGTTGTYNFTGYPAIYRTDGQARMTTDVGVATDNARADVFDYTSIETNPGNSGSPLWYINGAGEAVAVGVGSTSGWAADVGANYALIQNWIAGNDGLIPTADGPVIGVGGTTTVSSAASAAFDAAWYLEQNADVAAAGLDPLAHYTNFGWHEGRDPNAWFDVDGYEAVYADIAGSGVDPLEHYLAFGWAEGRDPSAAFDTSAYVAANPDVADFAGGPLAHYVQFGAAEGRAIAPSDDAAWLAVA